DRVARAAGNEPRRRIHHPDLPRRVAGLAAVLAGGHVPHLPRAIHLVAEAPIPHVVRSLVAVLPTQVAPLRALVDVALLDLGDGLLRIAGSQVEAQQRRGAPPPAPLDAPMRR